MNMRGFDSAISVRNMFNNIEDSTIQTLLDACKRNASIFHSYFQEKAKFLGMRKLHRYHYMLHYCQMQPYQKKITYNQAKSLVLKTFKDFTPTFREFAQRLLP